MEQAVKQHAREIAKGERFEFGANWARFLNLLDEERIEQAKKSLIAMLKVDKLDGKRFIDIGSGSGLFSLAARALGAEVYSFDYDPQSVACTRELRHRYFTGDPHWIVDTGSVLDQDYLTTLGQFDVVYSWGVLHHTGDQWRAMENAAALVKEGGSLFIALYNDQGLESKLWRKVKQAYNKMGRLNFIVLWAAILPAWGPAVIYDIATGRPFRRWRKQGVARGMSPWRDLVDWVGGYPFEVSKPEEVFEFYYGRSFELTSLITAGGRLGCNQYVFSKKAA